MLTTEGKQLTKTVAEGTALFTANTVLQKGIGLLNAVLIANSFSPFAFGILRLAQSLVGTASALYFPGASSVIVAACGRAKGAGDLGRFRALLVRYAQIEIWIGVFLAGACLMGAPILRAFRGAVWGDIALAAAPLIFFGGLRSVLSLYLQVFVRFRALIAMRFMESLANLGAVVVMLFFFHGSVSALLFGYAIAQAAVLLAFVPYTMRLLQPLRGVPSASAELKTLIRKEGIWALGAEYIKTVTENMRPWLFSILVGVEGFARFSLAESLLGHTVSLFPLGQTLLPAVSGDVENRDRMRRVFVRAIKYHLLAIGILCLFGFTLFPPIIHLLFPKYDASIPLYMILLIGLLFCGPNPVINVYLTVYQQQRQQFLLSIGRGVLILCGIGIFVTNFGIVGTAIEYVVTWVLYSGARIVVLLRVAPHLRFSVKELLRVDEFDREVWQRIQSRVRALV